MAEVKNTQDVEKEGTTSTVENVANPAQAQTPDLSPNEIDKARQEASAEKSEQDKIPKKEFNKRYYSGYFNAAVNAFKENGNLVKLNADISAGSVDPYYKYDKKLGIEVTNEKDLQRLVDLVPEVAQRLLRQKLLERYQKKIEAGEDPTVWAEGEEENFKNAAYDNAVGFIKDNLNECLESTDLQGFLQEKKVGLTHVEYFRQVGEIFKTTRTKVEDKKFEEEANILMVIENGKRVETLTPEAKQAVQAEAIGYLQKSFPPFPGLLKNEFSIKKDK